MIGFDDYRYQNITPGLLQQDVHRKHDRLHRTVLAMEHYDDMKLRFRLDLHMKMYRKLIPEK